MATKGIKIFFILSLIFYILLCFYLVFTVYNIRTDEFAKASAETVDLNDRILSSFSVYNSFASGYFTEQSNLIFNTNPELSGIIIFSEANGPEYLRLDNPGILLNYPSADDTGEWKPVLDYNSMLVKDFKSKLFISDNLNFDIIYIYNLTDRDLFFPVLRNTLIATLIHLVFSLIFIAAGQRRTRPEKAAAETAEIKKVDDKNEIPGEVSDEEEIKPVSTSSGMYSDRSGLVWSHFLPEKLDAELKRAASFDQDSCLAFISVVSPSGFIPYRNISRLIVEHFKYKDLAFESGDNTFCVIIPEKDIDDGLFEIEKFKKILISKFPDSSYKIYAGLTSRNSRLLSEKRMIHEAKAALARAESEPGSSTISFRTDLNKYREYIASNI